MKIEHIKHHELKTKKWSGGTTTQLIIYPKNSEYKKMDFLFRISTATIEVDQSDFTKLPGVSRKIMILDGKIHIEHKNHHSKDINKFEQDEFSGNWETRSFGKAIDFNLMTRNNTSGEIEAFILAKQKTLSLNPNCLCYTFYNFKGQNIININSHTLDINEGDVVLINSIKKDYELSILPKDKTEIILCKIYQNNKTTN